MYGLILKIPCLQCHNTLGFIHIPLWNGYMKLSHICINLHAYDFILLLFYEYRKLLTVVIILYSRSLEIIHIQIISCILCWRSPSPLNHMPVPDILILSRYLMQLKLLLTFWEMTIISYFFQSWLLCHCGWKDRGISFTFSLPIRPLRDT